MNFEETFGGLPGDINMEFLSSILNKSKHFPGILEARGT